MSQLQARMKILTLQKLLKALTHPSNIIQTLSCLRISELSLVFQQLDHPHPQVRTLSLQIVILILWKKYDYSFKQLILQSLHMEEGLIVLNGIDSEKLVMDSEEEVFEKIEEYIDEMSVRKLCDSFLEDEQKTEYSEMNGSQVEKSEDGLEEQYYSQCWAYQYESGEIYRLDEVRRIKKTLDPLSYIIFGELKLENKIEMLDTCMEESIYLSEREEEDNLVESIAFGRHSITLINHLE